MNWLASKVVSRSDHDTWSLTDSSLGPRDKALGFAPLGPCCEFESEATRTRRFMSARRMLRATRAPAPRQTRATARSSGRAREAKAPELAQAEIQQLALVGSSSSLHSEGCNALGVSDGVTHSGRVFTVLPTSDDVTIVSAQFRVLLLRRLRLPLALCPRTCRCGRSLDPLGDHRAACATSGVLTLMFRSVTPGGLRSCAMAYPFGTEPRATARHSPQPTRTREFRLPARHSASGGTRIRSYSVPADAALSSSALKQVGVGLRKPRHSFDFSPKPVQPAPLPPCAALLRPLGCTAGVASSRLPRSEPSRLRSLSFLPPLSSVLLVTHPLCTSCWLTHAGCRHPSTAASQPAQRRLPCTGTLTFAVVQRWVMKKMLDGHPAGQAAHGMHRLEGRAGAASAAAQQEHSELCGRAGCVAETVHQQAACGPAAPETRPARWRNACRTRPNDVLLPAAQAVAGLGSSFLGRWAGARRHPKRGCGNTAPRGGSRLVLQPQLSHGHEGLRAHGGGEQQSAGSLPGSLARSRAVIPSRQHGDQQLQSATMRMRNSNTPKPGARCEACVAAAGM